MTTAALWILIAILLLAVARPCLGIIIAVVVGLTEDIRHFFSYLQEKRRKK